MRAFTLAEVLITLGIIGVVAAMTLPIVINKNQERVTVTKVKKFYSVMNQALLMAIKDNGYVDEWNFYEVNEEGNSLVSDKFVAYIKPYLKISKDCGGNAGCIAPKTYKLLDGRYQANYDDGKRYYKMILADGSYLWIRTAFEGTMMNCSTTDLGTRNVCGVIWTDINGKQAPNVIGQDVFLFFILKNTIVSHSANDCKSDSAGFGCSSYILQNGDMKYLYK